MKATETPGQALGTYRKMSAGNKKKASQTQPSQPTQKEKKEDPFLKIVRVVTQAGTKAINMADDLMH